MLVDDNAAAGAGNAGAGTQDGTAANAGEDNAGEQPTMTQAQFDAALKKRLERANAAAQQAVLERLKAEGRLLSDEEIEARKAEGDEKARDGKKADTYAKQVEALERKIKAIEDDAKSRISQYEAKLHERLIEGDLFKALSQKPIRPDVGYDALRTLIRTNGGLKVEDDRVVVIDRDGQPVFSMRPETRGEEMSVEEFVESFLERNQWALLPEGAAGAGSRAAKGGSTALPKDYATNETVWRSLTPEQKQAAIQKQSEQMDVSGKFTFAKKQTT